MPPFTEEDLIIMNHIMDHTLNEYRTNGIMKWTPIDQAQAIYANEHLRRLSNDDLISLIAVLTVRLFETETQPLPEA